MNIFIGKVQTSKSRNQREQKKGEKKNEKES